MARYRDEEDDLDDDDERTISRSRSRQPRFKCPYCGSTESPTIKQQISTAGWVTFAVLLLFCLPLFWIGLLMKEDYRVCYDCGAKLG